MAKQIRLNAFDMNCVGHQSPGLWTHPDDRADQYNTLEYWTSLAKTLERGQFDALFLADVLGIYDVYKGSAADSAGECGAGPGERSADGYPGDGRRHPESRFRRDLRFVLRASYPFARRMSTLDHLTRGRIGWNIVTGYLESAARGMGRSEQTSHDERYAVAEDYMVAVYKLWEASWEDGAVLRDRARGRFADPDKIHRIRHEGPYFKVDAIHLCEPSPQRTPVLYQAGASTRGRQFAADHAECVFINGPSKKVIGGIVADIRRRAAAAGRDPKELVIYTMMTVITDQTREAAVEKFQDYQRHVSSEGALALMSGWTGVDFSALPKNEPIAFQTANAMTSALEAFTTADPDRDWTVAEIARHAGIGGRGPVIVGSYRDVADEFEAWVRDTDVDGFNLAYAVTPGTFVDIVDLVVPELRRRGMYKTHYEPGTLREKLYGPGRARLPESHPAARVRINR